MPLSDDMPGPWLSIVGIGEDGLDGLSAVARDLFPAPNCRGRKTAPRAGRSLGKPTLEWDTPFSASIPKLLTDRGQRVVTLCSGDPFWFGAGSVLPEAIPAEETVAIPAPSTFAWAAARLRWRLEETVALGLHARPIESMRPHLRNRSRGLSCCCATARRRRRSQHI